MLYIYKNKPILYPRHKSKVVSKILSLQLWMATSRENDKLKDKMIHYRQGEVKLQQSILKWTLNFVVWNENKEILKSQQNHLCKSFKPYLRSDKLIIEMKL